MKADDKTFNNGLDIRALRNAMHLSQEEMSLLFGVSMMTASKWERNVLVPDYQQRSDMTALWEVADGNPQFHEAKDIIREARIKIRECLRDLVNIGKRSAPRGPTKPGVRPATSRPTRPTKPGVSATARPNKPGEFPPPPALKENCTNCIRPKCLSNAGKANGGQKPDPNEPSSLMSMCGMGKWANSGRKTKPAGSTGSKTKPQRRGR